jgi:hypothetical protein
MEPAPAGEAWRDAAEPADVAAIDALPTLWGEALRGVKVGAEAELLDPVGALEHPALPPGSYHCRVVRVERGRTQGFPSQFCFVRGESDGRLSFNKQTGSDLPNGWLFADAGPRYVFLGAQQRRPGENSLAYGAERARDIAGVVERVGAFKWRLVVPRTSPRGVWVYELTPVATAQQPG